MVSMTTVSNPAASNARISAERARTTRRIAINVKKTISNLNNVYIYILFLSLSFLKNRLIYYKNIQALAITETATRQHATVSTASLTRMSRTAHSNFPFLPTININIYFFFFLFFLWNCSFGEGRGLKNFLRESKKIMKIWKFIMMKN